MGGSTLGAPPSGGNRAGAPAAVGPPTPPGPEDLDDWWPADAGDPALDYLAATLWDGPAAPTGWDCARLSKAAFVYRERTSGRRYLAKFYAAKTPTSAERHAERELAANRTALAAGLDEGTIRACRVFGAWRGVLVLEYVDGLTLDDLIAIRRDRPGSLGPALDAAAGLLASLHANGARAGDGVVGGTGLPTRVALAEARGFVDDLARSSVIAGEATIAGGLRRALDGWSRRGSLTDFDATLIHGDATTTNFVFPAATEVVAIDWERLALGDPADDLGRLAAEVAAGIRSHGGPAAEAEAAVERILAGYGAALGPGRIDEPFAERFRFHRASSTLRIARNGWLPQTDRLRLVAQASALLA